MTLRLRPDRVPHAPPPEVFVRFVIPDEPSAESHAFSRVPVAGEFVGFGRPTTTYKVKSVHWDVWRGEVTPLCILEEV